MRISLQARLVTLVVTAVLPLLTYAGYMAWRDGDGADLPGLVLVALLGGSIAWLIGRRTVVAPTRDILDAARRLKKGNLEARVRLDSMRSSSEFVRIAAGFNLMAESLQQRQKDLQAELGHSRQAYATLETVINSMEEGLMAVDGSGHFLMRNEAAVRMLGLDETPVAPERWPEHYGICRPGSDTVCDWRDLPLYRALRGESGTQLDFVIRKPAPEEARVVRSSFRPMRGEGGIAGALVVFTDITEVQRLEAERERSRLKLREAEAGLVLLRQAVGRLNDMVLITEAEPIDRPGPRIVFVNEAFERLTGYTAEEAIGKTPRMLQGPGTDRATLDRIRAALEAWQPVREELLNYGRDGRELWLELDIVPMADETGRYTHWISVERDITSRKHAQAALAQSEQRYGTLFEQGPLPMWVFDDQTTRFIAVNDAAVQQYGYSREEFLRMTLMDIRPERERPRFRSRLNLPYSEAPENWLHVRKDGSEFWVEVVSRPIAYGQRQARFSVSHDISKRVEAEKEVQEYLFMLQRAADASSAVVLHQTLQGTLQEVVEQARAVIRAHQGIVSLTIGQDWAQSVSAVSMSEKYAPWRDYLDNPDGSGIYARVCETNRPMRMTQAQIEAHPRWRGFGAAASRHPPMRGWLAVPLVARSGENIGVLQLTDKFEGEFTLQDEYVAVEMAHLASIAIENARLFEKITELNTGLEEKVFERTAELMRQEQALRLSNRELEAFSYSVSHDLRAPLSAIDGFSKMLERQLGEAARETKAAHYLGRIQASAAQMGELIEDLLYLARVSRASVRNARVDLSGMAREIVEQHRVQEPQREVTVQVQDGLVADGDAGLVRIVLENLLGNAWKFTSREPQAEITVGRMPGEDVFFVRDNGAGFDMAYADKLFGVFQRLHSGTDFPGTGIGLATVNRIVSRHLGRVWATAAPGEGATFYFTLKADVNSVSKR